jgi:hypothetical protein
LSPVGDKLGGGTTQGDLRLRKADQAQRPDCDGFGPFRKTEGDQALAIFHAVDHRLSACCGIDRNADYLKQSASPFVAVDVSGPWLVGSHLRLANPFVPEVFADNLVRIYTTLERSGL